MDNPDLLRARMVRDSGGLANFDALTGIANRNYFHVPLEEMMAAMARSEQELILHIVDLDFFKQVNDSLGHVAGDLLLQQAVERMSHLLQALTNRKSVISDGAHKRFGGPQ